MCIPHRSTVDCANKEEWFLSTGILDLQNPVRELDLIKRKTTLARIFEELSPAELRWMPSSVTRHRIAFWSQRGFLIPRQRSQILSLFGSDRHWRLPSTDLGWHWQKRAKYTFVHLQRVNLNLLPHQRKLTVANHWNSYTEKSFSSFIPMSSPTFANHDSCFWWLFPL